MNTMSVKNVVAIVAYMKITAKRRNETVQQNIDDVLAIICELAKKHDKDGDGKVPVAILHIAIGYMRYYDSVCPMIDHKGYYAGMAQMLKTALRYGNVPKLQVQEQSVADEVKRKIEDGDENAT